MPDQSQHSHVSKTKTRIWCCMERVSPKVVFERGITQKIVKQELSFTDGFDQADDTFQLLSE
jgi:hypothetical protein